MKANFKKYISIVLAVCLLMALVSLVACKDGEEPEDTQPSGDNQTTTEQTTTEQTTPTDTGTTPPEVTTPEKPAETTPVFPSDEESDPRQEDVFFD